MEGMIKYYYGLNKYYEKKDALKQLYQWNKIEE
jgi:hypothetical protein